MKYRYKNGFEPQWYKEENLKNQISVLEKYFLLLIVTNIIFVPLTIDKIKSYQNIPSVSYTDNEEHDIGFIESKEIKFIKLLMKSEFYDMTSYDYKDNKGNISFFVKNKKDAEKILLNLKENNIKIEDATMTPLGENAWKIEFKMQVGVK